MSVLAAVAFDLVLTYQYTICQIRLVIRMRASRPYTCNQRPHLRFGRLARRVKPACSLDDSERDHVNIGFTKRFPH